MKYTLEIPVLVLSSIPSASMRLTVASLYTLPLTVLKSSACANVANRSGKIAIVVAQSFTREILPFLSSKDNDKLICAARVSRRLYGLPRREVASRVDGHTQD